MELEAFIDRWTTGEGGAERANYILFLSELCDVLSLPRPEPAGADSRDYVFERPVRPREAEGTLHPRRIDLYKRNCFILEAKQSRWPGQRNAIPGQLALIPDPPERLGRRAAGRGWDAMMQNARRQAEGYVFLLEADHATPPFVITCDVGHAFEIYADFTGTGRAYGQFPDRKNFRIYLEDFRRPEIRELFQAIWRDPLSLDPARERARVTRAVAGRLAQVTRALERQHPPEDVAHFLMRCIFTMFADDVDLIPKGEFIRLLERSIERPDAFPPLLQELWAKMDEKSHAKRFYSAFGTHLRHFNGNLFSDARVFDLGREEIGELLAAARHRWTEVDPAIFGTLLEQALDPDERRRLGAHYTPRAYVQRLVEVTVMEPLRADWQAALARAESARDDDNRAKAIKVVQEFHGRLCATRVLDPACGTGNFLYVALEAMKRLEGEVIETLAQLSESERLELEGATVDPHQFLGLELNPRAAAIAELVVWIGYLQQHYRTHTGHPAEPILRAFRNINGGQRKGFDAVLAWRGATVPGEAKGRPVRPDWPVAEFIVGNPPFLGKGAAMRGPLGDAYVDALAVAHPHMNESADLVMYWWDRAAEILREDGSVLRRFGFVTTNSISSLLNRRCIERHMAGDRALKIAFAIPDHPWTKATPDAAAVRIAMTVATRGEEPGILQEVTMEAGLETDAPALTLASRTGRINPDLSIGTDVTVARELLANGRLSWNGMMLAGSGFLLTPALAQRLREADDGAAAAAIKPFLKGSDLVRRPKSRFVVDLFGFDTDDAARTGAPAAYNHVLGTVKPLREKARDAQFRERWWLFGRTRPDLRTALAGTERYIGTTETSRNRVFQFVGTEVMPDHMIVAIACDDAALLAVLSSRVHVAWSLAVGGWLGVGNDPRYSKSRCFDAFPFPSPTLRIRERLRNMGEELDASRRRVLASHPDLTMTRLYNMLAKLRSGATLSKKELDVVERGQVRNLRELHDTIDRLTAEAYGWPADLSDEAILERLVALNAERAREEAAGHVRWLRPDYQVPRFARGAAARTGELDLGATVVAIDRGLPAFPSDRDEQPLAVEAALAAAGRPMDAAALARAFKRGGKRIEAPVVRALEKLARYGRITALADGRFAARRAA